MIITNIAFLLLYFNTASLNLLEIRNLYELAANHKSANTKLIGLLENVKAENALLSGYKGAAIMMEANYVLNPITKLNRFKKGKQLIEDAIKRETANVELRYIRLTIQTNVPGFLGYSSAIEQDKNLLINQLDDLKDKDLRNRVVNYLLQAKICNQEELRKVSVWKKK